MTCSFLLRGAKRDYRPRKGLPVRLRPSSPQTGRDAVSGVVEGSRLCRGSGRGAPVSFFDHDLALLGAASFRRVPAAASLFGTPGQHRAAGTRSRHQQPPEGGNGAATRPAGARGRGRGAPAQRPRKRARAAAPRPRGRAEGPPKNKGPLKLNKIYEFCLIASECERLNKN